MIARLGVVCCERAPDGRIAAPIGGDGGETGGSEIVDRIVVRGELVEPLVVLAHVEERLDALARESLGEQFVPRTAVGTERIVEVE